MIWRSCLVDFQLDLEFSDDWTFKDVIHSLGASGVGRFMATL